MLAGPDVHFARVRAMQAPGRGVTDEEHAIVHARALQVSEAFPWNSAPGYLIRDNDAAYGVIYRRRLRAIGIPDRPTALRSPWQNGYAERLIGSLRRECLDHAVVLGEQHLRRLLRAYANYHNNARTHLALTNDVPATRAPELRGTIIAMPVLGGLHHRYARIE